MAEVHAEQRHRRPVEGTDGAQHRPVATETDHDVGVGQRAVIGVLGQVQLGAIVRQQPADVTVFLQPSHRRFDQGDDIGPLVVGDERDA